MQITGNFEAGRTQKIGVCTQKNGRICKTQLRDTKSVNEYCATIYMTSQNLYSRAIILIFWYKSVLLLNSNASTNKTNKKNNRNLKNEIV